MNDPVKRSISILRHDAMARGMDELAIVYGWSEIRISDQILLRKVVENERYRACLGRNRPPTP